MIKILFERSCHVILYLVKMEGWSISYCYVILNHFNSHLYYPYTLFIILILLSHKDNRSPYCSWLRALQPASLFSPPRSSPTHHKSIRVKYLNPLPIRKTII